MGIYVTDDKWANESEEKEIGHICPICKGNMERRFECVGKVEKSVHSPIKSEHSLIDANIEGYYCPQCELPIVIAKYPPLPINQHEREIIPFLVRSEE